MKSIEESVMTAMDGSDVGLFPFLPYILQDLWEIGTDPDVIITLIGRHFTEYRNLKVLDLGCGKGAVSVKVARAFGCACRGIDAIPEFISYAREKALAYGVADACVFEVGDIRKRIGEAGRYDVVILGSIGPVFGDHFETLSTLSNRLDDSGIIILDDGYFEDASADTHPLIAKKGEVLRRIDRAGMKLVEEHIIDRGGIKETDDAIFGNVKMRCTELIEKHPEKKRLFEDYIKRQEEENDVLENRITCSTMVIRKK